MAPPVLYEGTVGPRKAREKPSKFDTMLQALDTWVRQHPGQLPTRGRGDKLEFKLVAFLKTQQMVFRRGALQPGRLKQLMLIPGMPDRIKRWPVRNKNFDEHHEDVKLWIQEHPGRLPVSN